MDKITLKLDHIKLLRVITYRLLGYLENKEIRYWMPFDNEESIKELKAIGEELCKIEEWAGKQSPPIKQPLPISEK